MKSPGQETMNDCPTPPQLMAQINAGLAIRDEEAKLTKAIQHVTDLQSRLRPVQLERLRGLHEIEREMDRVAALKRSLERRLKKVRP